MYQLFILIITAILFSGCSSEQPVYERPQIETEVYSRPPVSGTHVQTRYLNTLRTPEHVKAYHIGRYEDPNNPDIMYEATVAYELTEKSKWVKDYNPAYPPFAGQYGYKKHVDREANLLANEFVAKNNQLREIHSDYVKKIEDINKKLAMHNQLIEHLSNMKDQNAQLAEQLVLAKKREIALMKEKKNVEVQLETLLKRSLKNNENDIRSKYRR